MKIKCVCVYAWSNWWEAPFLNIEFNQKMVKHLVSMKGCFGNLTKCPHCLCAYFTYAAGSTVHFYTRNWNSKKKIYEMQISIAYVTIDSTMVLWPPAYCCYWPTSVCSVALFSVILFFFCPFYQCSFWILTHFFCRVLCLYRGEMSRHRLSNATFLCWIHFGNHFWNKKKDELKSLKKKRNAFFHHHDYRVSGLGNDFILLLVLFCHVFCDSKLNTKFNDSELVVDDIAFA